MLGREATAARTLVADPLKAHMFAQALALRRQQVCRMRRVASLLKNWAKLRKIGENWAKSILAIFILLLIGRFRSDFDEFLSEFHVI